MRALRRHRDPHDPGRSPAVSGHGGSQLELPVAGMTCNECATTLKAGLSELSGVSRVDVDRRNNRVRVSGEGLDEDQLRTTIEELGYRAQPEFVDESPRARRLKVTAVTTGIVALLVLGALAFREASGAYLTADAVERVSGMFAEISVLAVGLAFLFGLLVGFAPVTLAMAPAVMGVVMSSKPRSLGGATRMSAAFVGGMVFIDVLVGVAVALAGAAVYSYFKANMALANALVTVLLLVMALITLGVWRPRFPLWLPRVRRAHGAGRAFTLGLPFGVLACPGCAPLVLPVALGAAATGQPLYGALLLGVFAVGRGVPLVVLGTSSGAVYKARGLSRWVPWIQKAVGVLLVLAAAYFVSRFFANGGFTAVINSFSG